MSGNGKYSAYKEICVNASKMLKEKKNMMIEFIIMKDNTDLV